MTRAEKWLLAGLGASLLINGLLAALLLVHPGRHHHHDGPDLRMGRMGEHLSPAARAVIEETLEARRATLRREFQAMRAAREEVGEALRAEPFDRAALEAAFVRVRGRQDAIRATIQEGFAEAASKLPREERIKLAQGGERLMRRMADPRPRHGAPPDDPHP
jgi:uncharacterized membrane protein